MRQLKIIRIFLTTLFFVATVVYLIIGPHFHPMAAISVKSQIILSSFTITVGVTLVWMVVTILFGRIYCSSVCPVGTLSDIFIWARKKLGKKQPLYSYKPRKRWSIHILAVYIICIVIGIVAVPYLIEPWNIMRNIASIVRPSAVEATWINLGVGALTGVIAGLVSLIGIAFCSMFYGRSYCTEICPYGTAMGLLHDYYIYHVEIDPDKCTSCGKCEDVCKASCIKVAGRFVDNSRCVRCFDCLAVCRDDAIRYQPNRNRPATPLFQRKQRTLQ